MGKNILLAAILIITFKPTLSEAVVQKDMTQRLADLRAEIETINVEIETMKKEHQGTIDALLARKIELESEKLKESGRRVQVDAKIVSLKKRFDRLQARSQQDSDRLKELITKAKSYLERSLPIGIAERRLELENIESDVKSGEANLEVAIASLWSWLDRELRATVDTKIVSQEISIEGNKQGASITRNAEVLALGTVAALFADSDGRFGRAIKNQQGWSFYYLSSQKDEVKALRAFESVRNRKSPGFIELPAIEIQR